VAGNYVGEKIAATEKRKNLTDFDRFKLMKAKQARNRLVMIEFGKLKKTAKTVPSKKHRRPQKKSKPT